MVNTFSALLHFRMGNANFLASILTALVLTGNCMMSRAQDDGTTYEVADGIDDLWGVDPSADICTTGKPEGDFSKVFCFYNVGAKKFLSIGGLWGTHASINSTPNAIWFESSGTDGQYRLSNKMDGSGTGCYVGIIDSKKSGQIELHMDRNSADNGDKFVFEKAQGYSPTNKVYRIKGTFNKNTYYVTTFPENTERLCNVITTGYATTDANYDDQVWKIISKAEYYELTKANPATMKAVIDISFLIGDPDFRVNDTDAKDWTISDGDNGNGVFFGDKTMYCTYANRAGTNTAHFGGTYIEDHQFNYGKYFYCYSRGKRGFTLYQDVKVEKPGWYILRCNGFSTQNNISGESTPLASLFATQIDSVSHTQIGLQNTSATLNIVDADEAAKMEAESDGAGVGVHFFNGEYENQVQLCIENAENGKPVSSDNPAVLRIGFNVEQGTTPVDKNELTCVDNFKLLYAGERRQTELILDEDNDNLRYITNAADDYTNTVLHLHRTLNDNKWNSLVLPVSLTYGQMKRTFGDDVKVAKLHALTKSSIQFLTVDPTSDDAVMVQAFEPYIVYPPVVDVTSQPYTVKRFYTKEGDNNDEWLASDGVNSTTSDDDALTLTIPANHYDITMVTLDRNLLKKHLDTDTWITRLSDTATGEPGTMTCLGTLAKTYNGDGIIEGRDNLAGDYFFYKGNIIQVPHDEEYGLKGFRCWFELADKNSGSAANTSVYIDGVCDSSVTGIDDIHTSDDLTERTRGIDGVFDLYGRRVRKGTETTGLPKGIYVTNGRKVVVR